MDTSELDLFFIEQPEPNKSCLLFLRSFFKNHPSNLFTEHFKWKLPNYYYKGKPFCYLWIDKKTLHPYIGFMKSKHIDHPLLELGNRKSIKTISIDPNQDIPIAVLEELIELLNSLYK